jgi:hypothetical protein
VSLVLDQPDNLWQDLKEPQCTLGKFIEFVLHDHNFMNVPVGEM